MASAEELRLRAELAEVTPGGGTSSDSLLSDSDITELLSQADGVIAAAAAEGWRRKAGIYAAMVNVSDAGQSRALGELQGKALAMAAEYERQVPMRAQRLRSRAIGTRASLDARGT
jgi:hypothetical protein